MVENAQEPVPGTGAVLRFIRSPWLQNTRPSSRFRIAWGAAHRDFVERTTT